MSPVHLGGLAGGQDQLAGLKWTKSGWADLQQSRCGERRLWQQQGIRLARRDCGMDSLPSWCYPGHSSYVDHQRWVL